MLQVLVSHLLVVFLINRGQALCLGSPFHLFPPFSVGKTIIGNRTFETMNDGKEKTVIIASFNFVCLFLYITIHEPNIALKSVISLCFLLYFRAIRD